MDWLGTVLPFVGQFNQQETSKQLSKEARQWEEDMYNKYNSPSALVRQYKDAGINPALMFGQPAIPAPTQTAPAETAPSPTGSVVEMLGSLMQLEMLDANLENVKADTRSKNAFAVGQETENQFKPEILKQSISRGKLDITQALLAISRFNDELENLRADTSNKRAQANASAASAMLSIAQKALVAKQGEQLDMLNARTRFENEFQDRFGFLPNQPIWNALTSLLSDASWEIGSDIDSVPPTLQNLGYKVGEYMREHAKDIPENVKDKIDWLGYFLAQ